MSMVFGLLALFLSLFSHVPYVLDVIAGKTKPQRVIWAISAIVATIAFANQSSNGGGWSVWFFGSAALMTMLILVLSISRGKGGANRSDKMLLAAVLLLAVTWIVLQETKVTTVAAIAIDAALTIPTIVRAYKKPSSEAYPQWVIAGAGGLFALLSITKINYILFLYPLYIVMINSLIIAAKYYAEHYKPKD